jgi:hypothetical protein
MVYQFGPGPDAQTTVPAHLAERYRTPTEEESGRLGEYILIHQQLLSGAALWSLAGRAPGPMHRLRQALASIASHNPPMPLPELTDDDKAILAALLRETIARDRFPLSPGGGPAIFVAPSSPPILGPAPPRCRRGCRASRRSWRSSIRAAPLRIEMSKRGHDDAGARPRRAILRRSLLFRRWLSISV